MNKRSYYLGGVVAFALVILSGCTQSDQDNNVTARNQNGRGQMQQNRDQVTERDQQVQNDVADHIASIDELPLSDLSDTEIADIMKMREEEKLARDVYITLGELWGKNVFLNIQDSEQMHASEVKLLIDRYELTDPISDDTVGVFASNDMQDLYDELIAKGEGSLLDALMVGATIEDMDIKDLQDTLARTDNEDVVVIYTNLLKGSQKHLQSFAKNIEREGGSYVPQYITQQELDEIIAMDREYGKNSVDGGNGRGLQDGSGAGTGNGGQGRINR